MRVTVFGATGGIGGHVVRQALDRGYAVTAVVRDTARLDVRHPTLEVATVPALDDADALVPVLRGSDAILSGVGPRGRNDGPVASTATRTILDAMRAEGVRRLVAISAAPVGPTPDGDSFLNRRVVLPGISALLKDLYADLRAMEDAIANSPAEWTVMRPPKLVHKPLTGRYRTAIGGNVARGYTISRADVAHAMLAAVGDPATIRRAIGIAY
ncbi:NAD-dependent epimerase/dehydratase family protein [Micromonospora zingiberis]|uniref:NAD-dependent epimerase/dehydratase family protein n=1 Tax=Micromonospora zingiberis TaxID=2053011 RepID=A0A4R0G0Z2_9ACTN|nr:NAD(P)H-binding protein [Micromonospora zingiberis]TCB88291.1 NAD-dependent epimerase/dehydratase family protein [Micromonospora zingiberis]